ncbi:MAG: hypothetical protein JSW28_08740 [Thermoplasmata archaeon]|nr:MAG: hypothetical protein JSW28_08740 [Thermoplasmata archaeon]
MSEMIGTLEKRLLNTREKIRNIRREITGGVVEDKVKELGIRTYDELDKDLDALHLAIVEAKSKAMDKSKSLYEELEQDISAARTKLREKRHEITGGVAEAKAREVAQTIKEKGEAALKEIEEDISKISDKLKKEIESE